MENINDIDRAWINAHSTAEERLAATAYVHYRKQLPYGVTEKKSRPMLWMEGFITGMACKQAMEQQNPEPEPEPPGAA